MSEYSRIADIFTLFYYTKPASLPVVHFFMIWEGDIGQVRVNRTLNRTLNRALNRALNSNQQLTRTSSFIVFSTADKLDLQPPVAPDIVNCNHGCSPDLVRRDLDNFLPGV